MSPPMLPQPPKSPCSKSENDEDPLPHHPRVIQIPQAALSSSLPPHICHQTGCETIKANVANELAHLAGLKLVSSKLNQAAQGLENGGSLYSQQQQQLHQNVAPMHSWQGGHSAERKVQERPLFLHKCSGSSPESYPTSYLQRTPVSWMPSQSLRPSSSYTMDGSEGGRLQQSRGEPAASTNQNDQMLNESAMQQTVPADDQNSIIPTDQNLTAMSGWQEHGQEAHSQNGQVPQIPVISHDVDPGPGFYGTQSVIQLPDLPHGQHSSILMDQNLPAGVSVRQGFGQVAHSQNGQERLGPVPSHDAHGPEGYAQTYPQQAVGPPCEISSAGTDQYGRVQILVKLPVPAAAEPLSIPLLQQSREEPAAATNQNGQMLNERTMEQTVPTEDQNSVILIRDHISTAISDSQGELLPPCAVSATAPDQNDSMQVEIQLTNLDSTEYSSISFQQDEIFNVVTRCPLDPATFTSKKWTLEEVIEIENHVHTASSSCPHGPHPSLQDLVVTGLEEHERCKPLLMACFHGDLEAVKRIAEVWGEDLNAFNVPPILGTLMDKVTPLFVAASKSYSNIVSYLLENGANVSPRTYSAEKNFCGLMPLHAAIRFGGDHGDMQISTVRCLLQYGADPSALSHDGWPLWFRYTLDGQIITLLVQWGLNLSQRSPVRGFTPLHYWARQLNDQNEDKSLDVVEMLLGKDADVNARDYFGFSVILTAAKGDDMLPNFPVLNFLLERYDIAPKDKIDALELAGAVILRSEDNHEKFPLALHYWSRALALRAEGRPLYNTPIKNQLSEWSTTEDLLRIEQDPTQREIQSLLVRLRILSCLSWRAVDEDYLPFFMEYLNKEVDENRTLFQMLDVSCVTIEKIVRFYPIESQLQSEAILIIEKLLEIIMNLLKDDPFFNSPAFETFFELVLMTDLYVTDGNKDVVVEESHIRSLCCMFGILSRQPQMITENMELRLKQIVRRDSRDPDGFNVLLTASCFHLGDETVPTVRLLLDLGADVNVVNIFGYSPLHCLAEELDRGEIRDETAHLLLEVGAHLDMVNTNRKTPADIWMDESNRAGLNVVWDDLPGWLKEDCKKLTCLSARVIRDHQVPYHGDKLPVELIPFVNMH